VTRRDWIRRPARVLWGYALALGVVVCGVSLAAAAARAPRALRAEAPRLLSTASPFSACAVGVVRSGLDIEPSLTRDPAHGRRLVAAWQQDVGDGARGIRVARSSDAGATWRTTTLPRVSQCSGGTYQQVADVWLSTGRDGTVYAATLPFDLSGANFGGAVQVSRSTDGGATWSAPVVVATGTPAAALDKEAVAADPSINDRAYMTWDTSFSPTAGTLYFARTSDGGRSWSQPRVVYQPPAGQAVISSQPISLADGTVAVLFSREPFIDGPAAPPSLRHGTSTVFVMRSRNGGATWSRPARVTDIPITPTVDPDTGKTIFAPMEFTSASSSGRAIDLVWSEIPSKRRASIRLMRSADDGKHWTGAMTVANVRAQAFTPTIAVAPDGTLAVTWYNLLQDKPHDKQLTATWRFARSTDAGHTWRQQQLGPPFDLRRAVAPNGNLRLGEYFGLTFNGGGFDTVLVTTTAAAAGPSRVESTRLTP
jgi:hypothetical protein